MVKIRRSRQPRDWRNKTHMRSNSGTLVGKQNFNLSEVSPELQAKKMRRNLDKFARQIKSLIQEKNLSTTNNDRKAEIEALILKREAKYYWATTRLMLVENRIKTKIQREKSRKANLAAEMAQAAKNAEKIRPQQGLTLNDPARKAFHPEIQKKIDSVFPRQRIENVGGKRKLKIIKKNVFEGVKPHDPLPEKPKQRRLFTAKPKEEDDDNA